MDDLPLQKIQISGPTLASLLHRFCSSPADTHGLLFGHISLITPSSLSDDPASSHSGGASTSSDSPNLIATVTSYLSSSFPSSSSSPFFSPSGHLNLLSLQTHLSSSSSSSSNTLIGWFSGRRKTPLRPSMRESSVTASLSSAIQFAFPVQNSSYTLSPCLFLLLTTPFQDQLIHTHQYKAYQFRFSTDSFESRTLDVVNLGPAFRSHYGSFTPNSPFPALPCELGGLSSTAMAAEDGRIENNESLTNIRRMSKDQKQLDLCAEGFEIGRLSRMMGSDSANYTAELEDLYNKMLTKLDGLARLVEKSSARVLEQENYNMKLRHKVAGLE